MRNPNGYGTVYKLKGRRRKPWIARITVGWTTTIATKGKNEGKEVAKQNYQTIGFFKTKQEGMDALALHRITPVSPKADITLKEVYEEWSKKKYNRQKISKSTENNYRAAWKYIQKLEKAKFKDLRTNHWQDIIDECEKNGLGSSTIKKIKTVAGMLNEYAMINDIVSKNYAEFIEINRTEKVEKNRFTDLEVKAIENKAGKVPWADTILIMLYSGMRISEMLGLTKFNIDPEKKLITGGIKTDAGKNRIIPIHPKIFGYVKQWYDKNGEALICDDRSKKLSAKRYREKMYYPALEEIKDVRRLKPHACRHTFCSRLAEADVETVCIQKLAGHADYSFTANEYTHLEIEILKKAINKI